MGKLFAFFKQASASAAVVFSILKLVLGNAQYADVGVGLVDADMLSKLLPAIAAFVFPWLSAKWPTIAAILKAIYTGLKFGSAETASVLMKTAALEAYADSKGDTEMQKACEVIRSQVRKTCEAKAAAPAAK